MEEKIIRSDMLGEQYYEIKHNSGLTVLVMEQPQYTGAFAMFGAKYGSVDTCFKLESEAEYTRRHRDEKRMKRISDYIEAHFQDPIRLADLAESEDITVTHLSHLIKDLFGVSFQEYLRNKRLEHALRLIHSGRPLSEISAEAGFSELKYMTAAFKETFHMTPAQYRRNVQQDPIETSMPNSSEYIWPDHEALPMLEQFL